MKNKKITIATNERSNMIAFLKGNYHLTTDHYYTHFGEHHSSNFDVFLQFDGSNPYALNSNVKTFGMDRYTKKEQVLILDKLGLSPSRSKMAALHTVNELIEYIGNVIHEASTNLISIQDWVKVKQEIETMDK